MYQNKKTLPPGRTHPAPGNPRKVGESNKKQNAERQADLERQTATRFPCVDPTSVGVSTPQTTEWKINRTSRERSDGFQTISRRISVCIWRVCDNKAFWAQVVANRCRLLVGADGATRKTWASQEEGSERTVEPVFGYHGGRGKDLSVILSGEKREIIPKNSQCC